MVAIIGGYALILAEKTKAAINAMLEADQGAKYRGTLAQVLPHIGDAYSTNDARFRGHLGASLIGQECMRAAWYSWRWHTAKRFDGRMIRLFNRGHLEEGRIIAMLLAAGIQIFQQDPNGKQFRISNCMGHFAGSGDGVALDIPDVPAGEYCLLEFKTSADKIFKQMVLNGVFETKLEHYVQMQEYMHHMGLKYALYIMINKNNDELHCEIVKYDANIANMYLRRAWVIVQATEPPKRISESPGWHKCKYCDHLGVCKQRQLPDVNCRTCKHSEPVLEREGGLWLCNKWNRIPTVAQQMDACEQYEAAILSK